jgi:hypothetical protein
MSAEQERLSQLLKMAVPEPPAELSADQITTRSVHRSAKSWALPTLAAAAVAAIGITIWAVAPRDAGPAVPAASGATSTRPAVAGTHPQPTATCQGTTVFVPNVVGMTAAAATASLLAVGLNVTIHEEVPPSSPTVPPGTVLAQALPAGSRAAPGAVVDLLIAMASSTTATSPTDPDSAPSGSPSPMSSCQATASAPPAQATAASAPNVIGLHQAQAVAVADGFDVIVNVGTPPSGSSLPPGTVFAQEPAAGSATPPRSAMTLYVAP